MAVFPDRIVLKNSTDSKAQIEAAIQSGGSDEISQGEVVIGLSTGAAALYTKDAVGTIVTLSGKVTSVNTQIDDVTIDLENLGNFQYRVDPTKQSFVIPGPPTDTNPTSSGQWGIGTSPSPDNFPYFAWYDTDPVHSWLGSVPIGTAVEFVTRWGYKHTAITSSVAAHKGVGSDWIFFSGYPWPQELLDAQEADEFIIVQEQNAFLAPADGEALAYEASTGLWRPSATSGVVSSINGRTGSISFGVDDLDDYAPQPGTHPSAYHDQKQSDGNWPGVSATTGGWSWQNGNNYSSIYINKTPTSGTSLPTQGFTSSTLDLYVSVDGVNYTQHTATSNYQNSQRIDFSGLSPDLSAYSSATAFYFSLTAPGSNFTPLADGDILQYEASSSKWRPVPLTGLGLSVASIDDIGDVDTTTVAPTDGQTLVWDNVAQQWEPGVPGTALPAAQDGEALIYENGQWVAGPVIGGVDYTPADTDANIADVSLLLLFNGSDGSTTFTDSSPNALTVTPSGNAQISTTESKYGGAAGYFDGAGDKIVVASDPGMAFAAGDDFTIEFWIWPTDAGGILDGGIMISANATSFTTGVSQIVWDHGNARNDVSLWNYAGSTSAPRCIATLPSKEAWHHVAFVRSGTTLTPYVDGVAGTAGTSSNAWDFSDGGTAIGDYNGSWNGSFNGYLDDLRVTKGVARYTSNFTPPAQQLGTSAGDIVIPYSIDKLDDVDTSTVAPVDGQALVWDNTAQKWEPGSVAAEGGGGRGDGGDFDTGTVDSAYVFGVYGGGDFSTGSDDAPAELLGDDEGPDGGSF